MMLDKQGFGELTGFDDSMVLSTVTTQISQSICNLVRDRAVWLFEGTKFNNVVNIEFPSECFGSLMATRKLTDLITGTSFAALRHPIWAVVWCSSFIASLKGRTFFTHYVFTSPRIRTNFRTKLCSIYSAMRNSELLATLKTNFHDFTLPSPMILATNFPALGYLPTLQRTIALPFGLRGVHFDHRSTYFAGLFDLPYLITRAIRTFVKLLISYISTLTRTKAGSLYPTSLHEKVLSTRLANYLSSFLVERIGWVLGPSLITFARAKALMFLLRLKFLSYDTWQRCTIFFHSIPPSIFYSIWPRKSSPVYTKVVNYGRN